MKISEETPVSLFVFGVMIAAAVSATLWIASIDAKAAEAKEKVDKQTQLLIEVRDDVIRIKEHFNIKSKDDL